VSRWKTRRPEPPAEMGEWMSRFGEFLPGSSSDDFASAGLRALQEALRRPGRENEGAFALLAADGLLTYAAGDLVESDAPARAFEALLARVAATAPGSQEGAPE
jgi:hypothetical protein